jgi:hypothetical protein
MKLLLIIVCLAASIYLFGQRMNTTQTGIIDSSGLTTYKYPAMNFATLPAAAACAGCRFIVKDASAASSCSSGGGTNTPADCYSQGGNWISMGGGSGGGGGGTPGSPPLTGGGSTVVNRLIGVAKGNISISAGIITGPGGSVAANTSNSQEINIITGLNGDIRYELVVLAEQTKWTSTVATGLTAGMGRPGTNDIELLGPCLLMQGATLSNKCSNRPDPPILGSTNSYPLVIVLTSSGGNISDFSAGNVYYEVHAYSIN